MLMMMVSMSINVGDFRLRLDDIRKLNALHSNGKYVF